MLPAASVRGAPLYSGTWGPPSTRLVGWNRQTEDPALSQMLGASTISLPSDPDLSSLLSVWGGGVLYTPALFDIFVFRVDCG